MAWACVSLVSQEGLRTHLKALHQTATACLELCSLVAAHTIIDVSRRALLHPSR